ncbi:hypothetical protein CXQ85_002379 [Candidozyma haemuli]|uniref:Kinesin-like protein n=1 Tax=Candidozyma haemuli TaxID=45357 RepID=A0A2V1AS23_9ASCO|nr:hypothetical protein CXQ85_002379 [[Candida] haemuloni]PVH20585.1 hypothetical protein CXQ85_002379 [[Candida] haemuloni]
MSRKTEIFNSELKNRKLEDEVRDVSKHLREVEENVKQLDDAESESIKQIDSKFELKKKDLLLSHDKRLMDLKETLSQEIDKTIEDVAKRDQEARRVLQEAISSLDEKITLSQKEKTRRLISLKEDHGRAVHELTNELENEAAQAQQDSVDLNRAAVAYEMKIESVLLQIKRELTSKQARLEDEMKNLRESVSNNEADKMKVQDRINSTLAEMTKQENLLTGHMENIDAYKEEIAAISELIPPLEHKRRLLHAKLHDLKGNIRVFCRIRPDTTGPIANIEAPSPEEFSDNGKQDLIVAQSETTSSWSYCNGVRNDQNNFQFDKIFNTETTNAEIFEEWCHFIEIYNETIVDLFGDSGRSLKHEIKHDDSSSTTTVTNLKTNKMTGVREALEMLQRANKRRATAATDANDRSSRSHSVLSIKIRGCNEHTNETKSGTLHLVDLAGSERIGNSHATGARLKETQAINKSLSCLGDVIYSIARKNSGGQIGHVPYRNSKLTYLLKNSLQGDSKTLMFVNISPLSKNYGETVNSLRFATKVNRTKVQ